MFISSIYPTIYITHTKSNSKVCAANSSAKLYASLSYHDFVSYPVLLLSLLMFFSAVVLRGSSGMSFPAVADKVSYDVH